MFDCSSPSRSLINRLASDRSVGSITISMRSVKWRCEPPSCYAAAGEVSFTRQTIGGRILQWEGGVLRALWPCIQIVRK
eukprot:960315-Prorocentrum_minimum.AAC.6